MAGASVRSLSNPAFSAFVWASSETVNGYTIEEKLVKNCGRIAIAGEKCRKLFPLHYVICSCIRWPSSRCSWSARRSPCPPRPQQPGRAAAARCPSASTARPSPTPSRSPARCGDSPLSTMSPSHTQTAAPLSLRALARHRCTDRAGRHRRCRRLWRLRGRRRRVPLRRRALHVRRLRRRLPRCRPGRKVKSTGLTQNSQVDPAV